jgi:putative hydrolase of the HAD superfamily
VINTIIFDIGNVLARFCWKEMFESFGLQGEAFERVADATVRNDAWNEFDKGLMSTEEIIDVFSEVAPEYRNYIEKIFEDPTLMIAQFDYAKDWIKELKDRGYRVFILSNWSEPTYHACLDNELDFLPLVDGAVFSFQEHVIKPNKKIFEIICERYDINPNAAVFLDDNEANVISSREFGLHTIHFKNYEQGRAELEELLAK